MSTVLQTQLAELAIYCVRRIGLWECRVCVKTIWETVYCKKSVAYMSGDMNVIGCVHVHGRLSCMSNCLSIPVLQEAVY